MRHITTSIINYSILGLLLLCSSKVFAQTTISGSINNEERHAVIGVSVTITDTKENIIKYAITDKSGRFSITLNSTLPTLVISARGMGYAAISKTIDNKSQQVDFVLKREITQLKEVIVKNNNVIRKKNDTISYSVSSFADQKDRSIADVLAKMPGIEIQPDGKVLYQGKPIQKYYIEGIDLLEGKYNLANNNLPHQSVSAVQILENHQPIRILDSLVSSDRASLNIKLKNNIAITGTAKLATGFSPLLWSANITPMVFTRKKQTLLSYQTNNTGNDVSRQLKTLTFQELMESLDNSTEKKDLVSIMPVQLPNIASNRYLNNNIHLITANHITKLKKDAELRFNISYLNDYQIQEGENTTAYFLPTNNVVIQEKISNRIFANELLSNIAIEKNSSNIYFKNSLKAQINWEGQNGSVINNANTIIQQLNNPYYSFTNQLKLIKKQRKQLFTIYSLINYNKTPQNLTILPGQFTEVLNSNAPYEKAQQNINAVVLQTNNFIEFTKGIGLFTITSKIGINIQNKRTESDILVNNVKAANAFQNEQEYNDLKLYAMPTATYKKNKWELQAQTHLIYNSISIKDNLLNNNQSNNGLVVKPRVNIRYEINPFWQSSLGLSYDNSFQNAEQVLTGFVLSNYRNLQQKNYPIAQSNNINLSAGISFRNAIKSIFFHSLFFYTKAQNPFIIQNEVLPNGTQTLSVKNIANETHSYNLNSKLSKYFHKIKSTFALGLDANYQKGNQLIGNSLVATINQMMKPNFKINTRFSKKLSADYILETNFNTNKTERSATQRIFTLSESMRLSLYPAGNQYLGIGVEHYYNDVLPADNHNIYTDISYRYTITKKKIDFELSCSNLFNTQFYVKSNFNDFYFYQSLIRIRPRQLLASISFTF